MAFFSDTVQAALAGRVVRMSYLVHFDFATTPMRLWLGAGTLVAGGQSWSGIGELGSISDVESAIGDNAPVTTYTLSGVSPALLADALASSSEVKGRNDTLYLQFFDDTWRPLDNPYAVRVGQMDVMSIKASGPGSRGVSVTSETLFSRRSMPPWGWLTSADQARRFPSAGDTGLDQVPAMVARTVTWPSY